MKQLILGEATRALDERYRLSIPPELLDVLAASQSDCILAKERLGCLSLWSATNWPARLEESVNIIQSKILARRLDTQLYEVQRLGRLLSTRHRPVKLAGRGRLIVPEGFREFLGVEAGGTVAVLGAAVCVEIWHPEKWHQYLGENMPAFGQLLDQLVS